MDYRVFIVKDKNGLNIHEGDRVILDIGDSKITGIVRYDPSFWAYAVIGDDEFRYLLMDNLFTSCDLGNGVFGYSEIEKIEQNNKEVI